MNAQQLKNSILQRAIEGKLVEQRAEEGTAAELLREIKAEKARLVKEGKLKKEKPLPEIKEEEIPFEIPESWEWVRLCEVAVSGLGKTLNKTKDAGISKPYLCSINVYWNGISLNTVKKAAFDDESQRKYRLQTGDLLICEGGETGRAAIWEHDIEMYYQNALHRVRFFGNINPKYFLACLQLYKYNGTIDAHCKGVTIKHFVQSSLNEILFPLPPLAEQKRIVAKIEELLPHVEQYGKAHDELTALNEKFPDAMKKSILQYAMEGKLVEQREEEGTAKELFAAIKAEKAKLVKEGKLKKEKPLRSITAEEIPFEIPESWEWVRLGEICFPFRYGTSEKSSKTGRVPVLRMGNIQHGSIDYSDLVYTNNEEDIEKYQLNCNDLLFNRTNSREWVGKTALYRGERPAIFAGYLIQVTPFFVDSEYLNYVMNSEHERNYCKRVKSDGINQSNVNAQKLSKFPFPLPPLAEQKRIVAKIEELLALLPSP